MSATIRVAHRQPLRIAADLLAPIIIGAGLIFVALSTFPGARSLLPELSSGAELPPTLPVDTQPSS
jgi:hypothetical protein